MSTKIYEAYRVPLSKLNDFIDITRKQTIKQQCEKLKHFMKYAEVDREIPGDIKGDEKKEKKWIKYQQFESVLEKAYQASQSPYIDAFDVECGLNIWIKNRYAYVIPIGCAGLKWRLPKYAEDYSYWDNTDRPKKITLQQWGARCRTWESINCGYGIASHNARRMYHSFIDLKNGKYTGSWELKEKILGDSIP